MPYESLEVLGRCSAFAGRLCLDMLGLCKKNVGSLVYFDESSNGLNLMPIA